MTILDTMTVEQLQGTYSDYHKELYGFRPRSMSPDQWTNADWLRSGIAALDAAAPAIIEAEAAQEAASITEFEHRVAALMHVNACNRAAAVHCIMDKNDKFDQGYTEYLSGIPYGYIARTTPGV